MRREVLFHKCDSFLSREEEVLNAASAHRVDVPRAKTGPETRFSAPPVMSGKQTFASDELKVVLAWTG